MAILMRKKKFLLIPITVAALISGGLFQVSILEVKDGKSGEVLFFTRVVEGDIFEFNYIHSVEKTLVEGMFLIEKNGSLRIMETRFFSYGAGLPNVNGKTLRKNGLFVTEGGERLENLRFLFSPINRPVLKFRDKETALGTKKDEGGLLEISVRNNLFILQALRELCHPPFNH